MDGVSAFPQYRRTADGRHLYRIEAPDRFTELQRVGGRWLTHRVEAKAYPERLKVMELLEGGGGRYHTMDAAAWEEVLRLAAG